MALIIKDFYIPSKPYLTKKLDHKTLVKLLGSSPFVVEGIYMITNNANQRIELFEQDDTSEYTVDAYVKVNYAYASKARAQVGSLKPFRKLILKKPSYNLNITVCHKKYGSVYVFSQKYTRINTLMDIIQSQYGILNQFIVQNHIETNRELHV